MNKDDPALIISGRELISVIDARRVVLEKEIGDCARSPSRIGMLQGHVDELRDLMATREKIRSSQNYSLSGV
jgi:hypothetical protein